MLFTVIVRAEVQLANGSLDEWVSKWLEQQKFAHNDQG